MNFDEVRILVAGGKSQEALALLSDMHRAWHDRPREHVLIHAWQVRIAWKTRHYRRAAWEVFALIFAAPTSLVQKYLGLVRKNI
ncbi:MAG TPA: hypothetical protein PKZ68_01140 [Pseudomonadales bacterium]|jgi:hypothetical protein|nr:hypothetical protein [Pseudomonadales bacterium]